jgi:adenine-specific DNA-methyltransferase
MSSASVSPNSELELVGMARALGAARVGPLGPREHDLLRRAHPVSRGLVHRFEDAIAHGGDPLGEAFCRLRTPGVRRRLGATYTPDALVDAMTAWALRHEPNRVLDPGAGSGRFVVAAGRAFPKAALVAVELDPLAALLCRAHLRTAGLGRRARVFLADYRELELPKTTGRTLFVGNPPYVRHHDIAPRWKRWLAETATALALPPRKLAGLHVHFALATARWAKPGDYGAFVTSAEWLDVNYGSLLRGLFLGPLGGQSLHAIAATARVFPDADATAVIGCFELGTQPDSIRIQLASNVSELGSLDGGRPVARSRLAAASRWTPLARRRDARPSGFVELGELCRVHRGQVTGANRVWIAGAHSRMLPDRVLYRTVTRAKELFLAGESLDDASLLKRVIDLPIDLESLTPSERRAVERFLGVARTLGAHRGFIASHRRAWWAVGLREPAPILATYMARRPPAFVRNPSLARHINVAHGLYPRERLPASMLDALARYLSTSTRLVDGRTYAGGLTKFEPKEMERLLIPGPGLLSSHAREHPTV